PLAEFNALSFSRPLFVTILAAIVLREAVGPRRWGAVAAGFVGVLIMAVPGALFFWLPGFDAGATEFGLAGTLAVASALAFAGAIILVKRLSAHHTPLQLIVWANLISTLILTPGAIWFWSWPSFEVSLQIIALSLAGLGAQYAYVRGMSVGDASFLSPMDYLRLPMAAVVDFAMIKLLPGPFVWLGAAIIIGATLYITLRESRLRRG
ncbi:MAG: DMT family transporter, partial [Pseudomonadota bacterium]